MSAKALSPYSIGNRLNRISRLKYTNVAPAFVIDRKSAVHRATVPHIRHIGSTSFRGFTTATMAEVPSTMKAVIINNTGGTEVLQHKTDVAVPELKVGEILVKNEFLGVNFIDT